MARSLPALLLPTLTTALCAQDFRWSPVQPAANPPARTAHAGAGDLAHQTVVLFGGLNALQQPLADTWLWNGTTWQQASGPIQPAARSAHAMAYDESRQRVVLFGGRNAAGGAVGDTWEWNGATWTQIAPAASPAARFDHAMAYDAATGSVLLFGGTDGQNMFGDTWRWNGTTWTQLLPASMPVARSGHALAGDTRRERIVLFGGRSLVFGTLADTWEWNGSTWLPALGVIGAPNPIARREHQLAFDPLQGTAVLFGGEDTQGERLADTWRFDGGSWVQVPTIGPVARTDAALCFDQVRMGLQLFGGSGTAGVLADTWSTSNDRAAPYGWGCGTPALRLLPDVDSPPVIGHVATATILDAPTPVATILAGFSNQFFGPFPLPLTMSGIGLTDCDLLQSLELFGLPVTPLAPGALSFAFAVPDLPALIGIAVHLQALAYAPGENPAEFVLSNGLSWTFREASIEIVENFATDVGQDLAASSARWNNGARAGLIGGDGRHGSFDVTLGVPLGSDTYEWNSDSFVMPGSHTLSGEDELVLGGAFQFTDFVLPAGTTLVFAGSAAPQIRVRGDVQIEGTIRISAPSMPFWVPASGPAAGQRVSDFNGIGPAATYLPTANPPHLNFASGQPGGAGGPGGGRGGRGGDECRLDGDATQTIGLEIVHLYYGRNGEDVRLPAGHAFANAAVGTGGKGSRLHPLTGGFVTSPLLGFLYRANFTPGGGGGGFSGAGGTASGNPPTPTSTGVTLPGGSSLPALVPIAGGATSLNHFLIGGSGGGGGGSHAYGTLNNASIGTYVAGAGGTGGGGAMALRAGGDLVVAAGSLLEARGGEGVLITADKPTTPNPDADWGVTSPGGGGSGGSFLLQAGRTMTIAGDVDVSGGNGSRTGSISVTLTGTPAAFNVVHQAGNGAPGFYRLEAGGGVTFTGTGTPAFEAGTNDGPLADRDARTGSRSKWLATGAIVPPVWLRYELDVDLDGNGSVDTTYTDSGAPGTQMANDPNGAVRIRFQGAHLPLPGHVGPWRDGIGNASGDGLGSDSATSVRFDLTFDSSVAPNVVVRALRILAL